jgi:hypothetical protein
MISAPSSRCASGTGQGSKLVQKLTTLPALPKDRSNMGLLTFASDAAENDVDVAVMTGQKWVPQLPVHSKSVAPTQGSTGTVPRNKYKSGITTARDQDWLNPAQLYPTTGPGNIAPHAGSDFRGLREDNLND